jgi:hypothetical protein
VEVKEGKPRRAKPVAACPCSHQNGSAFLACSRALMRFLATAVLCMKRRDSLPVSTMWQWCVSRSSSAVVIFASPARGAFRLQLMVCGRTSLTIFPRELSVSQRGVSGILCKRFGLQLTEKRSPN